MGNTIRSYIRPPRTARILFLGLDGGGKSTILFRLILDEVVTTILPQCHIENLPPINNTVFTVWDLPGGPQVRQFWSHYYQNTQGVVFVVDGTDVDRLPEAREQLSLVVNDGELCDGVPFMVFVNKQDVEGCLRLEGAVEGLGLEEVLRGREWRVQETSAVDGNGLREGLSVLADMVKVHEK